MKKVRMTPIALKDLKEIKSYISEELLSEEAAFRRNYMEILFNN